MSQIENTVDANSARSEMAFPNDLDVKVAHSIPGRLRLRMSGLSRRPAVATQLETNLQSLELFSSVRIVPRSSSVILTYDPRRQELVHRFVDEMLSEHQSGQVELPKRHEIKSAPTHHAEEVTEKIADTLGKINQRVEAATGGIDLKLLVPISLLAFSIFGLLAGAIRQRRLPTPSWYDLLWFAFNTFIILNLTISKIEDTGSASPAATEPPDLTANDHGH
jgi:hypothetical protein